MRTVRPPTTPASETCATPTATSKAPCAPPAPNGTACNADIDVIIWHGGKVQHSLTADAGYTMSLELESQLPEDIIDELADDSGSYAGTLAWYRDAKTGEQRKVTAGDQAKPKRLTYLYASKANAQRAADREWKRL